MKILISGSRRLLLIVMAVWAVTMMPARAADTVAGVGRLACDDYLEADENIKLAIENWVFGFFSFANLRSFNIDLLQNLDNGTLIDAIEEFCRKYPGARIADVSTALLKQRVASADEDCSNVAPLETNRLSLCHVPGAVELDSAGLDIMVPAVE